jgi:hypothetical protein
MTEIDFSDVQTAISLARRESHHAARLQRLRQVLLASCLASGGIVLIAAVLMVRLF